MPLKYIDVSSHQNTINWSKVKGNVDGVIIRAGYGKNNIDKQFVTNISECNRLGIPCGVYWFSYAYTADMAAKEAEYCLAAIKPYKVELPVCFDFEYDSVAYAKKQSVTVDKTLATAMVHAFCGAVEAAGYYAMNYANPDYLSRYFDSTVLKYDLWLANYKSTVDLDSPPRSCGIWQYSSKGSVDGISGNVDMNAAYKDYASIIGGKGTTTTKSEGTKVTITVYQLKKGSTGENVKALQILLNGRGYSCGTADGKFGSKTLTAVKAFQKAQGLTQDGVVGAKTWAALLG